VYDNLARYAGGRIIVIAPSINYADGLPIIGWREHDRRAPYRVVRLPLLRTVIKPLPSRDMLGKLAFRITDLLMRLRLVALLFRLMRSEQPDAVCVGELVASVWLINVLRRFSRVPTIVYVHGEEITTEDSYDPGHRRARRALLKTDRIVVVSRFTRDAVLALIGSAAADKICLIENGVDTTRFLPMAKSRHLLDLYGLQDAFVFVSVCRLLEKKGIDNAIRAFAMVAQRHSDCRYLVVGTGPYDEALRRIAAESGFADRIVFAGEVPDEHLVEHYCLGDVFVMPNRRLANGDTEGFGLVFLEANGCGLPVIAGNDGGTRDAVRHHENGLVVDGRSVDEIAAAMLALREDATLRDDLRRRGMEIATAAGWRGKAELFLQLGAATPRI
jgi:phosphatidylinositol alpha-1,6-mannosyltransferase